MSAWRACVFAALTALLGASGAHLDSQNVLQRYAAAVAITAAPKIVVYSYTVSQVGPSNIEQHHRIYRSGLDVRDETLSIDGITLLRKAVRFSQHEERYSFAHFAPSAAAYELLFLDTVKDRHHLDYVYETTPLTGSGSVWIDRLTIDGISFLPRFVHFHSSALGIEGSGEVQFGAFGRYWMPISADASARIGGKLARERIDWSDYRFPQSLPPSTFQSPQPLPRATLPPI